MKKRYLAFWLGVACTAIVLPASAGTVCQAGMIRNTYGFESSGFDSNGVACASTGTITFSSNTELTVNVRSSCNDNTTDSYTANGTYSLAGTCIGTATVSSITYRFTVVNGGNGLVFIAYAPGIVLNGTAIKT